MTKRRHVLQSLLLSFALASGVAGAADPSSASEKDPLRATLMESKEKNRGVTVHANGSSIPMLVTSLDEHYVIGRSQQATRIIVRLDRIDGVSAAF